MVGWGLFQGGHAQEQGRQYAGLVTQVALYPGMVSLGSLLFYPSCLAGGPSEQKYIGISEINSHGPGDTHVSTERTLLMSQFPNISLIFIAECRVY